jgi:adenylate cyclase
VSDDIFISYARSTADHARRIAEALRGLGYAVWRDDELPAHRSYADVIEERLTTARAVVVVWSAEAVRSEWVRSEANRAREDHKLVQLSVDGARLPMPFDQIQCADLVGWTGEAEAQNWRKVVESIADLTGGPRGPAPKSAAAKPKVTVCVLPFSNISGEAEQEYFSDGISEDIITDLSKVSALEVTARNTAFTFKGKAVEVPQVAKQLSVSHVLEGSVRKSGARVRITAQLIDGATGNHLWAERYDRDLTDIFALQDEISEAIVSALKLKLLPQEKKAIERRGTNSAEAYDLCLLARRTREAGNSGDPREFETIIRLCERALKIDPNYALAWALMGGAQQSLALSFGRPGDDGMTAVERALALDPDLAEAHAYKARRLQSEGKHGEALAEVDLALRLDPDSYDVNNRSGTVFYQEHRFSDAVRTFQKAVAISEADFAAAGMLVSCFIALGDFEGARRTAVTALERAEKAIARDSSNGRAFSFGVTALAVLGQRERAREWIDRALLLDPDNMLMRYNFACALSAHLNDVDGALDLLNSTLGSGYGRQTLLSMRADPDLDPIRDDPRFQAMMAEAEARLAKVKPGQPA